MLKKKNFLILLSLFCGLAYAMEKEEAEEQAPKSLNSSQEVINSNSTAPSPATSIVLTYSTDLAQEKEEIKPPEKQTSESKKIILTTTTIITPTSSESLFSSLCRSVCPESQSKHLEIQIREGSFGQSYPVKENQTIAITQALIDLNKKRSDLFTKMKIYQDRANTILNFAKEKEIAVVETSIQASTKLLTDCINMCNEGLKIQNNT